MAKNHGTASITYSDKTAEMGTPAAEALVEKFVKDVFPELKGGTMPIGVRIEIKRVEAVNIKPKNDKIVLSMEAFISPGDMARLRYLTGQGVPISAVIESPQAPFDLVVSEVNLKTGEIVHPMEPVGAGKEPGD
jgi:hypothetical protein